MKRFVIAFLLVLIAPWAWGDIVLLKDGTRKEGKITKETGDTIWLEISSGGMTATLTILRKDILEIQKKEIDYSEVLPPKEYYDKRLGEIAPDDAKAHFDLGLFAKKKALYREAAFCLEKAMTLDEVYRGRAREHLYEIKVFRERECREALDKALGALGANRILTARDDLVSFLEEYQDCDLSKDKVLQKKLIEERYATIGSAYGKDLETLVKAVKAKAELVCKTCQGKKTVSCETCGGSGNASCKLCEGEKSINCEECAGKNEIRCPECKGYGKTERWEGRKRVREPCKTCKESGLVTCPDCKKGKVECTLCKGKGVVKGGCETCASEGHVTCSTCEGTGEKEPPEEGTQGGRRKRRFGGPR